MCAKVVARCFARMRAVVAVLWAPYVRCSGGGVYKLKFNIKKGLKKKLKNFCRKDKR